MLGAYIGTCSNIPMINIGYTASKYIYLPKLNPAISHLQCDANLGQETHSRDMYVHTALQKAAESCGKMAS